MSKHICVDFSRCKPEKCDEKSGMCPAAKACAKKLLLQESAFEPPVLTSTQFCIGCGKCLRACPLNAIEQPSP
ncbi:MAG: 4Fe-4S binding protein [Chitinivibrionales bacterium]|nr:4Fe-4S binding protein [Chitinivibrionales bacterium]